MQRTADLYPRITAFSNLLLAARKAQRGKRFKRATARFNLNLEAELIRLQRELQTQTYHHGGYRDFWIHDPKRRLISAAPYRDRVVHHALCNVIEPIFERTFIFDSYACRKGKGTLAAVNRYSAFARSQKYVLKCDIRKYFQSVDHEILRTAIRRKIKCPKTLWLIDVIIASRTDDSQACYFNGDDFFTPFTRKRAIPIGNLTSQFFANLYLNGFDHYVKETLHCRRYIRYVDDFVVFDNDIARLRKVLAAMRLYLEGLRLRLHDNKSRVYRVGEGVSFLGYRIFPTHRLLKKQNALHMRRKLAILEQQYADGQIDLAAVGHRIQSWIGHAAHADSYHLRERILGSVIFQRGETGDDSGRLVEQQS